MFNLRCQDVNSAFATLSIVMEVEGKEEITRNGPARALPMPLAMTIERPTRRVMLNPQRDANPTFHLMEALWMLAGRRDVEFISQFSSNIANYSDDGETFHGAYGWRWRHHFAKDQLAECVNMLKANPLDRRAVMAMYDPTTDLNRDTKDVPCNTQIMWRMVSGKLHMTTTNRSNDLVWGLCGANFVHMTVLQEWAAAAIGVPIGYWHHFTNNLHVYPQHYSLMHANHHLLHWREYPDQARLVKDPWLFRVECKELCDGKIDYFKEPFFDGTVAPMVQAWHEYKGGNWREAMRLACCIDSDDWRIATTEWYERRKK